jgi:predicted secreted hydrolase
VHRLQAEHGDVQIDLVLQATKPPIPHGDEGYSPKGPEPGQASQYYSYTRMSTQGTLRIGDTVRAVSGLSWMDHEWSTSALGEHQVGWDWFSFQLADGGDLMLFQLRDDQGGIDPFSSGTHVGPSGEIIRLDADDFEVQALELWRSAASGATYPAQWRVAIPSLGMRFIVEPLVKDQELRLSYTYWEGAVSVRADVPGAPIVGYGYVELTGYARSMQAQF